MKKRLVIWSVSILTAFSAMSGEAWQASWIGAAEKPVLTEAPSKKNPEVVIKKAFYGVSGNPAKQVDLTKKIQQAVTSGNYRIQADNATAGQDPAYGTEKTLELEFTLDGELIKKSVKEKAQFDFIKGPQKQQSLPKDVNQWSCFRKVVHLDKSPREAVARISADQYARVPYNRAAPSPGNRPYAQANKGRRHATGNVGA